MGLKNRVKGVFKHREGQAGSETSVAESPTEGTRDIEALESGNSFDPSEDRQQPDHTEDSRSYPNTGANRSSAASQNGVPHTLNSDDEDAFHHRSAQGYGTASILRSASDESDLTPAVDQSAGLNIDSRHGGKQDIEPSNTDLVARGYEDLQPSGQRDDITPVNRRDCRDDRAVANSGVSRTGAVKQLQPMTVVNPQRSHRNVAQDDKPVREQLQQEVEGVKVTEKRLRQQYQAQLDTEVNRLAAQHRDNSARSKRELQQRHADDWAKREDWLVQQHEERLGRLERESRQQQQREMMDFEKQLKGRHQKELENLGKLSQQRLRNYEASQQDVTSLRQQCKDLKYQLFKDGEQLRGEQRKVNSRILGEKTEALESKAEVERQFHAYRKEKQRLIDGYRSELVEKEDSWKRERLALRAQADKASSDRQKMIKSFDEQFISSGAKAHREKTELNERLLEAVAHGELEAARLRSEHDEVVERWRQKSVEQEEYITKTREAGRDKANELRHEHADERVKWQQTVHDLQKRLEAASGQRKQMKSAHEVEMRKQLETYEVHERELIEQKSMEQEEYIAKAREEARDKANKLRQQHADDRVKLQQTVSGLQKRLEAAAAERKLMKNSHEVEMRKQLETYEMHERELIEERTLEKKGLVEDWDRERKLQAEKMKTDREGLITQHQRATQHVHAQVDELNVALVTRDDESYCSVDLRTPWLPQKSDGKLRESFAELEEIVDYLGRLAWSPNSKLWPEQDLQKLSGQQGLRELKKAIVQDLVWCCLYDYVFASPFRLFGAEGEKMEKEWVESCGQEMPSEGEMFVWPDPSAQRERWRYMTLSRCREILTEPISSEFDPRARIKKAFGDTIGSLAADVKSTIVEMTPLAAGVAEKIDRLAARAVKTWFDFQLHRCRILMRLAGTGHAMLPDRIDEIRKGSVTLTVSPSLGRYGNNKGSDLGIYTEISGGSVLVVS